MQAAFDTFDTDCRGTLAFVEIKRALRSLGIEVGQQVMKLFAAADTDHDGALRFTEFCDLVGLLRSQGVAMSTR